MSHCLNIGGLGTLSGGSDFQNGSIEGSDFQNGFFLGADFEIYIFACKNPGLN